MLQQCWGGVKHTPKDGLTTGAYIIHNKRVEELKNSLFWATLVCSAGPLAAAVQNNCAFPPAKVGGAVKLDYCQDFQ